MSRRERIENRMNRRADRERRREYNAEMRAKWRRRYSWLWRNRWNLVPVGVGIVLGIAAWSTVAAALLGRGYIVHIYAALIVASSLGWTFAGQLRDRLRRVKDEVEVETEEVKERARKGGRRARREVRELIYVTLTANYAVTYLYATRYLYFPFLTSMLDRVGMLLLVTLVGWVPLAIPYWRHYKIRRAKALQAARDTWPARIARSGMEGAVLVEVTVLTDKRGDYRGKEYRGRCLAGQTIEDFSRARALTAFKVPIGGTVDIDYYGKFSDVGDTTSTHEDFVLQVIERNPWKDKTVSVTHPLVANLAQLEKTVTAIAAGQKTPALEAAVAAWMPGTRSIKDTIPVACSHIGTVYEVTMWHPNQGAISWLIGGAAGSGKGVFINNLIAGIVACRDTWLCLIDTSTKQGRDGRQWGKAIDKLITTKPEAIQYLRGVLTAMNNRSVFHANSPDGQKIHIPTADAPLGVIVIDEASSTFASSDDPDASYELAELVSEIARLGRSDGWCVVIAAQRPDNSDLGGGSKMKVNLKGRIQLPVENKTDAVSVLDHNYQTVDVPLADRVPQGSFIGIDYVTGITAKQQRTFTIDDYPTIQRLGRLYANNRAGFTKDRISTQGGGAILLGNTNNAAAVPAQRGNTNNAAPTGATTERNLIVDHDVFADPAGTEPAPAAGTTARQKLGNVADQLATLREDYAQPSVGIDVPVSVLVAEHEIPPVPEYTGDAQIRTLFLAALDAAGEDGCQRRDLVKAVETWNLDRPRNERLPISPATTLRVLQQLRDTTKEAEMIGVAGGARWHRVIKEDASCPA